MDLVLFGIQGSGKGTQAKRLAAEFGYEIFEAGRELRNIAALAHRSPKGEGGADSELGKRVKAFIDVGKLVPHEIIMDVLRQAVSAKGAEQKLLFDGLPRDLDQMRDFNATMRELGRNFRCLHLRLDPEEGLQRILGRAKVEGRTDDASESTIRKRMAIFTEKTTPVIEEYRKKGVLTAVEAKGSVEEIYGRIVEVLGLGVGA